MLSNTFVIMLGHLFLLTPGSFIWKNFIYLLAILIWFLCLSVANMPVSRKFTRHLFLLIPVLFMIIFQLFRKLLTLNLLKDVILDLLPYLKLLNYLVPYNHLLSHWFLNLLLTPPPSMGVSMSLMRRRDS